MRALRWSLLAVSAALLLRFVLAGGRSPGALALFAACGGAWFWLQRRKLRELDGPSR